MMRTFYKLLLFLVLCWGASASAATVAGKVTTDGGKTATAGVLFAWPEGRGVLKPLRGFAGEAGSADLQVLPHAHAPSVSAEVGTLADRHDP